MILGKGTVRDVAYSPERHRAILFSFFFLAVGDPTFNRFYKLRCSFFSLVSAKRELILFLLMYVFIQQPESGKAPIESIMPEVREMPFYRLINDPLGTVMGGENVKRNVNMADFDLPQHAQVLV